MKKAHEHSKKSNFPAVMPEELSNFLNSLVHSTPGSAALIQISDSRIVLLNDLFQHFLEYSQGDANTSTLIFTDLFSDLQTGRFENYVQNLQKGKPGETGYLVSKLTSKNGSQNEYYTYASKVKYNGTDLNDYALILLYANLSSFEIPFISHEAREVYMEEIHNDDFGLFEWLPDQQIVCLSASIARILESEQCFPEVKPEFLRSFIAPSDRVRSEKLFRQIWESNVSIQTELRVITAKKNIKILRINSRAYHNNEDKKKIVVSVRDITHSHQIEQNYLRKVEELANSNAELEEFAYVASHDLQEPLRKISTFCSRLEHKFGDKLDDEGRMYLERALVSAENMRLLINDLLEFSRISKTKQPVEEVDLNLIFRIVRTDLELSIEETQTELMCDTLPSISGIKSQIVQLFSNLISNAIKFRKEGTLPKISITKTYLDTEKKAELGLKARQHYVSLNFRDNGIGFDNQYANRIFQVFQRLHGKTEYSGSGIGLAICKKIVEYHHGLILAESRPGSGAEFRVVLPCLPDNIKHTDL